MIKIKAKSIYYNSVNEKINLLPNKILILLIILVFVFSGCHRNSPKVKTEKNVVQLTERQIAILRMENLSADYDELGTMQKKSIIAIEELLVYLEDKYKVSFSYVAYYTGSVIEHEHLSARAENGNKEDIITVTRKYTDGKSSIEDDYPNIRAKSIYRSLVKGKMDELVGLKNHFVVIASANNRSKIIPNSIEDLRDLDLSIGQNIFIKDSSLEISLEDFSQTLINWLKSENIQSNIRLFLLKDEDFAQLNEENFSKYQLQGIALESDTIIVEF